MKGMEELNHAEAITAVKSLVYDTFGGEMNTTAAKREKAAKAKELLLKALTPGDTVYCICTHWSSTSANRSVVILLTRPDCEGIWNFSALTTHLLGWRYDRIHDGVVCTTSAELVYQLAYVLFGDGLRLTRRDL